MIEIFLSEVVNYLTDEFSSEDNAFRKLVVWYFRMAKSTNYLENESAREELLELQKIKKSYHTGKSFVKNQTKGEKKGFNFRYEFMINSMLKRGNKEEAIEYANNHLDWIKRRHSERTYYRHKKKIRSLGIEL